MVFRKKNIKQSTSLLYLIMKMGSKKDNGLPIPMIVQWSELLSILTATLSVIAGKGSLKN
jgi:hypothetical protein